MYSSSVMSWRMGDPMSTIILQKDSHLIVPHFIWAHVKMTSPLTYRTQGAMILPACETFPPSSCQIAPFGSPPAKHFLPGECAPRGWTEKKRFFSVHYLKSSIFLSCCYFKSALEEDTWISWYIFIKNDMVIDLFLVVIEVSCQGSSIVG